MLDRKKVNIFLIASVVLLVLVAVRFNYFEKLYDYFNNWTNESESNKELEKVINENPQYIYETFLDKNGNEIVVEMERKIIEVGGKYEVLYEENSEPDFLYYNRYEGYIKNVDGKNITFVVERENKRDDGENYYHDLKSVEDYEIVFNLDEYDLEGNPEFGTCDNVSINLDFCPKPEDFEEIVGKKLWVHETAERDYVTKDVIKGLAFMFNE